MPIKEKDVFVSILYNNNKKEFYIVDIGSHVFLSSYEYSFNGGFRICDVIMVDIY